MPDYVIGLTEQLPATTTPHPPTQFCFDRVSVIVRFADEPGGSDPSYLDASRPVADVLRESERARTTPATTPSS